jgi:hypothetical protein
MLMAPVSTVWAHFIPVGEIPIGFTICRTDRLDRYLIREVRSICGEAPSTLRPGTDLARIESQSPIRFPSSGGRTSPDRFPLRGVLQHLHYTPRSERTELEKISRFESDASSEPTAVLIPIRKSAEWWKLSQDERQVLFQKTPRHEGHHGIGRKYADRIFRRLYHSRYVEPTAPYDFLTYFEFEEMDVPYFRKLISELRDIKNNPEWLYVDFEYEIWMTKRSLSPDPISTEPT